MTANISTIESAAERAEAFLSEALKDRPRRAGDVLLEGKDVGLNTRTIQRASVALDVTKRREAFRGGWIWSLTPDAGTKAPSPDTVPESVAHPLHDDASEGAKQRACVIAVRLQKLEAVRGYKAPIYPQDPRVIAWAASGVSDPDLREAYERATYDQLQAGHAGPITAGVLNRYMQEVVREGAKG